jgi:FtsP/CotA-like multicopper oxidase with cupredoxin domain
MRALSVRLTAAVVALALGAPHTARAADCQHRPAPGEARATANDNRAPSGTLRDGVLRLVLVARTVAWYPDGPGGCAILVHAFAEDGAPAQIPGPLVRVRAGTEVSVRVGNALDAPIWVRGLHDRTSGSIDSAEIAPGAAREFRFRASIPGAWYYWAGAAGKTSAASPTSTDDGELVGALVVDPVDGPSHDRVFVMTRWTPRGLPGNAGYQLNAINGRSWPHTERLEYTVGDSVRWHVINASEELHMMHLHGFYFRVDARGDAAHDSTLARQQQNVVVTTATRRGEWVSMTWSPDRAGNWLFHCHFTAHMSGAQRLDRLAAWTAGGNPDGAMSDVPTHDMAGLLLGVTVKPRAGGQPRPIAVRSVRSLQLFADMRPRVYGERPGYGFVLQEGARPPARDSLRVPGTPLILTKGDPVAITVHNRTTSPFAVHWHGIELESYFDGVAGWSGTATRLAPLIAPNDSFVARFTPPRAGTFIYHTHNEPGEELASGLYAPLIVLEPGVRFDPRTERVLVLATGGPGVAPPTVVNGKVSPDTMQLVAGQTYRLRVIDISSNEAHTLGLRGPAGGATWRPLARDGRDLPADRQVVQPARVNTAAGLTMDVEFTPDVPGDYALDVTGIVLGKLAGRTVVPIRVRTP